MIARFRRWNEDRVIRAAIAREVHRSYADEGIGHTTVVMAGQPLRHVFDLDILEPALGVAA